MKKYTIIFLSVIFIISTSILSFIFYRIYTPNLLNNNFQEFVVKDNESVKQISKDLVNKKLINREFYFNFYVWLKRADTKLKAGVYELNSKMSVADIANILTGGQLSREGKIIITEGQNSREIADTVADFHAKYALDSNNYNQIKDDFAKKFLVEVKDPKNYDYGFFADKPKETSLEGYLYPDTYRIYRDTSPEEIINKMLVNFDQKLTPEIRQEIKNQKKTIYEVLTLASIVQKEVKTNEEMRMVAGVYNNRLEAGKALESDSTLTYITGKNNTRSTKQDLKIKNPYNTYRYKGLPPGPIGNPSIEAIEAVLYPEKHDYMFFITDPKTGQAIFSKTGEEHQEKVDEYLNQ